MIALIGDYNPAVVAHQAIPQALAMANAAVGTQYNWEWIGTDVITDAPAQLGAYSGIWAVPASPYRSMEGALAAIRFARETGRPFLGTCGGFQHAIVELARNMLGQPSAHHAEINPTATELVVTPLSCSLVGKSATLHFCPDSLMRSAYGCESAVEAYRCNYGFSVAYRERFEAIGLRFTAVDDEGEIRAAELPAHPFYVGTLFQPERATLQGRCPPLAVAFVRAVAKFTP